MYVELRRVHNEPFSKIQEMLSKHCTFGVRAAAQAADRRVHDSDAIVKRNQNIRQRLEMMCRWKRCVIDIANVKIKQSKSMFIGIKDQNEVRNLSNNASPNYSKQSCCTHKDTNYSITHLSIGIMKVHRQFVCGDGLQHLVEQLVCSARSPGANSVTQGDLVTAHVQEALGYVGHLWMNVCKLLLINVFC